VGSNRRRRRREQSRPAGTPRASAPTRSGWRQTIDSWGGLTVIGSLAAAILVIGILVVANLPGSGVGGGDWVPTERTVTDGRVEGDISAPVRMIEFADFQCPFCKDFELNIAPTILDEYVETGKVSLEFRYFAFIGPESIAAAAAAECANDQGRFWDYHDILFLRQGAQENRGAFSTGNLKDFARELQGEYPDFDLDEFDQCVDSDRHESTVEAMRTEATQLGVTSTPSFLLNGQAFPNTTDVETLRTALDAAYEAATS
jgi:protein-disulfide isomerase